MTPHRRVVAAYAVTVAGVTLPTPLYVAYQDLWELSSGAVATLYALYPIGVLAVLALAGHWTDELGRRRVLFLGLAAGLLSAVVLACAVSPLMVAGGRLLTGISSGFVVAAAGALLVELAPPERRRRASVAATTTNQLGLGLGALAAGALVQLAPAPERLVFALHASAVLAVFVLALGIPETARRTGRVRLALRGFELPHREQRAYFGLALAAFAAFALCGLLAALAPSLIRAQLDSESPLLGGAAVCLVFVASAASQVGWRHLDDIQVLRGGLALLILSLGVITLGLASGSIEVFLVGVGAGGISVGGVFMSSASLVHASTGDDRRGGVTATYLAITFLGLVVPVVVTGFAADHLSQVQATGVFSAAISLVVLTACYLTRGLSWRSTGYDVVEPV